MFLTVYCQLLHCVTGLGGMLATVLYGVYGYNNRGTQSTSVFLMHLRVKAQSMIVGSLTLGVGATLIKDYFYPEPKKTKK